jgi:hypothetical protein
MEPNLEPKSKWRLGFHRHFTLIGILLLTVFLFKSTPAATITVMNNAELVNGNTTSPSALIANPGPDGISLPEAMKAVQSVNGPHAIIFDPSLKGSTIVLTGWLPNLDSGLILIDGDIDHDGKPDITIDGAISTSSVGFRVLASDITIKGFDIQNFSSTSIQVFADSAQGWPLIERVTIQNNRLSGSWAGIAVYNWGQHCTINDIMIEKNEIIENEARGIEISAALGSDMHFNQINSINITANVISGAPGDNKIPIFITGATAQGNTNNVISGVAIVDNAITGYTFSNLLISAGNERNCMDNRIDNVLIERNTIQGTPVTMEILGGVGIGSTGNRITNLMIEKNNLTGGGIQLVGAQGGQARQNGIETIHVGQNCISDAVANGVYIIAGADGAENNFIKSTLMVNNLIVDNTDAGILLHGADSSTPNNRIEGVSILNNTIVDNGNQWAGGININSKSSTNVITEVKIVNTILWNNQGNDAILGSLDPDIVSCSILNDLRFTGTNGNFYSAPAFVNPSQNDFHLQRNSPCLDKGDSLTLKLPDFDFEGDIRMIDGNKDGFAIVDIGADEYAGGIIQQTLPWLPLLLFDD